MNPKNMQLAAIVGSSSQDVHLVECLDCDQACGGDGKRPAGLRHPRGLFHGAAAGQEDVGLEPLALCHGAEFWAQVPRVAAMRGRFNFSQRLIGDL